MNLKEKRMLQQLYLISNDTDDKRTEWIWSSHFLALLSSNEKELNGDSNPDLCDAGPVLHQPVEKGFKNSGLGPVSRTSRKLLGPKKPFLKLRPAYSVKLVFSYDVKGIKIKITALFLASRRLRFEDTKRIMSSEMRPKSFGTFEKRAPEREKMRWSHSFIALRISNTILVLSPNERTVTVFRPNWKKDEERLMPSNRLHTSFPATKERRIPQM